jgi:hypothetical protein
MNIEPQWKLLAVIGKDGERRVGDEDLLEQHVRCGVRRSVLR